MPFITKEDEFKGNKVLQIWEVDEQGKEISKYPVITFGKKKAQAIASVSVEVIEFAENE